MKKTSLLLVLIIITVLIFPRCNPEECIVEDDIPGLSPVTDIDGNTYQVVKIGNQIWMAKNLNYFKIPGSWCYDNVENNCDLYGRLYIWETAIEVCPDGWHLPTNKEQKELLVFLGAEDFDETIKSASIPIDPLYKQREAFYNVFSKPLSGWRRHFGASELLGQTSYYWSSTLDDSKAYYMKFKEQRKTSGYGQGITGLTHYGTLPVNYGFSVRCIKDQ